MGARVLDAELPVAKADARLADPDAELRAQLAGLAARRAGRPRRTADRRAGSARAGEPRRGGPCCARLAVVRVTMLLADFAQVSDGKLTIVGGGWSLTGPDPVPFGIAILIRVPWDQANQRHVMRLELLDADGQRRSRWTRTTATSPWCSSTTSRSRWGARPVSSPARRSTSPSRSTPARCRSSRGATNGA